MENPETLEKLAEEILQSCRSTAHYVWIAGENKPRPHRWARSRKCGDISVGRRGTLQRFLCNAHGYYFSSFFAP